MTNARILVVSDRALSVPEENRGGPILETALRALGLDVDTVLVGSARDAVHQALKASVEAADVVITVGATGIRPGDAVVDVTRDLGIVELPGIAEEIRRRGAANTPVALVSRALAGLVAGPRGQVFLLNAPSSRGGAKDAADVLTDVLPPILRDLAGHERD